MAPIKVSELTDVSVKDGIVSIQFDCLVLQMTVGLSGVVYAALYQVQADDEDADNPADVAPAELETDKR